MASDETSGVVPSTARARRDLERVRRICLALPEATEVITWDHPTFRTGDKIFASFGNYQGEWCVSFKTSVDEQTLLCMDDRFYVSRYVGKHGWTTLRLVGRTPWGEVERLVHGSFRRIAKKRLVALLGPIDENA